MERGGSREARDRIVQKFVERQEAIEVRNEAFSPMCIFAEATTTNGTHIIPFKRGAFSAMRTVTPTFFSIAGGSVSPTYDVIELAPLQILLISSLSFSWAKINIMPDFVPTPWMLENHDDKGSEPWSIYAWCVRDAISKHSGIKTLDEKLSLKDKKAFESLMNGHSDRVEVNG